MPKMNERERLADLEARQKKLAEDILAARRALRGKYAAAISDLEIEQLSDKEFRDILTHAIRVGGAACLAALKPLPHFQQTEPSKRP
ncbi:hypothetical protein [Sphingobium abikonense]|uniref:hypothetical protein n=1 Tax=Sphingobium abikonense TaxID=86193 RepID=UPI0009FBF5AF|nr:hypothetical protein [Sphingobium abikonense]